MWDPKLRSLVHYNLEQLGPTGFQDLAASLAVAVFGPNVQVLGAGRDGGRDMTHTGRVVWSVVEDQPGEVWDGYTVFQVKHKRELATRPESPRGRFSVRARRRTGWRAPGASTTLRPHNLLNRLPPSTTPEAATPEAAAYIAR